MVLVQILIFLFSPLCLADASHFIEGHLKNIKPSHAKHISLETLVGTNSFEQNEQSPYFFSPESLLKSYKLVSEEEKKEVTQTSFLANLFKKSGSKTNEAAIAQIRIQDQLFFLTVPAESLEALKSKKQNTGSGTITIQGVERLIDFFELPYKYNEALWMSERFIHRYQTSSPDLIQQTPQLQSIWQKIQTLLGKWEQLNFEVNSDTQFFSSFLGATIDPPFSLQTLNPTASLKVILVDKILFSTEHHGPKDFPNPNQRAYINVGLGMSNKTVPVWPTKKEFSKVNTRVLYVNFSADENYLLIDRKVFKLPELDQKGLILHETLKHIFRHKRDEWVGSPLAYDQALQQITATLLICKPNGDLLNYISMLLEASPKVIKDITTKSFVSISHHFCVSNFGVRKQYYEPSRW